MSPAWIYPEDGDRMIPGNITGHLGGDNWVADATIKIMQNENWSGLFVNFGAIDKVGHMWGGGQVDTLKKYEWDPNSIYNMVHEPFIAKNADTQLGRLIGELKATGQFDNTLIVVVADHGSTAATKHFYGTNAQGAGDYNWYHGDSLNGRQLLQRSAAPGRAGPQAAHRPDQRHASPMPPPPSRPG